jgi:hypothetical protein
VTDIFKTHLGDDSILHAVILAHARAMNTTDESGSRREAACEVVEVDAAPRPAVAATLILV